MYYLKTIINEGVMLDDLQTKQRKKKRENTRIIPRPFRHIASSGQQSEKVFGIFVSFPSFPFVVLCKTKNMHTFYLCISKSYPTIHHVIDIVTWGLDVISKQQTWRIFCPRNARYISLCILSLSFLYVP